ncbi:MAG: TolC family outer membrane protein [Paracoccaceae bacterium]
MPTRMLIAALLAAGVALPAGARAETLADALIAAYRNSNILDQNRAVLRAADEDVATAVSSLRPVLQWVLDSGYSRSSVARSNFSATLALSGQVVLWDAGRNKLGVDIAKEAVLSTREALVQVEQDILLNAVDAYFMVRSELENVAINQNSVRVIGETLRATQDQFEVGEVTRTDVALAEAQLASARAGLAAAEGRLAAAREVYKATVGAYPGTLAGAPREPALPPSVQAAAALAQRQHPAIRRAQREVNLAELRIAAAAAERRPELTADMSLGLTDGGRNSGSVGLSMSQTIYAGGRLSAAHRKAIAGRDGARAALHQTAVEVGQGVATAWANIEVLRAQIVATEQQIRAATVAYRGVQEEAKLGARTTLDVLNAEQSLLDAQASRIEAEAELQVAIYSLLSAMGLLTVDHLSLGIPTYDAAAYYEAVKSAPATSVQGKSLDRVLQAIGRN